MSQHQIIFVHLIKSNPRLNTRLSFSKSFQGHNPCFSTRLSFFYLSSSHKPTSQQQAIIVFQRFKTVPFSLNSTFSNKIRVFLSLPYFQFSKCAKRSNCRYYILSGSCILFQVQGPSSFSFQSNFQVRIIWKRGLYYCITIILHIYIVVFIRCIILFIMNHVYHYALYVSIVVVYNILYNIFYQ